MAFDNKEYLKEYKKKYRRQFKIELNIEEYEKLISLIKKHNMKNVDFIRWAMEKLEKDGK